MSYLVLARKYRPRNFEQMVGQEHVVQALSNALTQQRLHHAYLFTGTRGVGKTTVSRVLAKSLNCTGTDGQGGITAQPCGVCAACVDIDAGRFIDYVELDAASNRGVDEISQLLDQAVYKPVVGRFKVYMIDEVHMLTTTAFNAMLKTLEEPPEYLKFVLATTDPQKVPVTVLSRCLQFNLRPMAPATIQDHLAVVLQQESLAAEAGALRLISRAAHGSMRDALSLADQAIAFGAGRLDETTVRQMLGAVDRSHAVRLIEAIAAGDGAGLIAAVDALRALGLSAAGTLEEMATLAQQMAVLQAVPAAADESDPDTPAVQRLAGLLQPDETQLLYSIVLHGRSELPLAPDEYAGLVMVLLRVLAFRIDGAGARAAPSIPAASAAVSPRAVTAAVAAPARASMAAPVAQAAARSTVQSAMPKQEPVKAATSPSLTPSPERPAIKAREPEPPPWVDAPWDEAEVAAPEPTMKTERSMPAAVPASAQDAPRSTETRRTGASAGTAAASSSRSPISIAAKAEPPPLVTTPLGDRWNTLVKQMIESGAISNLVRELAQQSECMALEEGAATRIALKVESESLRSASNRDKLQVALAGLFCTAIELSVDAGTPIDTPARRDAIERERRQREAEHTIQNDPLVQEMMRQYSTARIVPGSVKPH